MDLLILVNKLLTIVKESVKQFFADENKYEMMEISVLNLL